MNNTNFFQNPLQFLTDSIASRPLWIRMRDLLTSFIIWGLLVHKALFSPGTEFDTYMGSNFFLYRSCIAMTLAFYPATSFWLHHTRIVSDKTLKEERAIARGKDRFTYRKDKTHFKGYAMLAIIILSTFILMEGAQRSLPALLLWPLVFIPVVILFLPELTKGFLALKNTKNK